MSIAICNSTNEILYQRVSEMSSQQRDKALQVEGLKIQHIISSRSTQNGQSDVWSGEVREGKLYCATTNETFPSPSAFASRHKMVVRNADNLKAETVSANGWTEVRFLSVGGEWLPLDKFKETDAPFSDDEIGADGAALLNKAIITALTDTCLTARQLVNQLKDGFEPSGLKKQVNSSLYKMLSDRRVKKSADATPLWSLVHAATVMAPRNAAEAATPAVSVERSAPTRTTAVETGFPAAPVVSAVELLSFEHVTKPPSAATETSDINRLLVAKVDGLCTTIAMQQQQILVLQQQANENQQQILVLQQQILVLQQQANEHLVFIRRSC
jgi:hypothetical protein